MQINYKKELNEEQYEAVTTTEGPLLILAGAGSGKTRTLIYRVAYLIENGTAPEQILLLTFTNKAAKEMKDRAKAMLDDRCAKITACTYHSFCAKILRKYYGFVGLSENFTIISGGDCTDIITMLKAERKYNKIKGFPPSNVIIGALSTMVNKNLSLSYVMHVKYRKYEMFIEEVSELIQAFEEYKLNNNMVDYDDLLIYMLRLLTDYPTVREKMDNAYKYIMVDEYQDTNYLQDKIVFKMRETNHNLTVVGDDFQSIYGFRGSCVKNILSFPDKQENCKVIYLTKNYRSNQEIMDLSNHMMKNNATEGFFKEMAGMFHKGVKPKLCYVNDSNHEAQYVVNEILRLHSKGMEYKDMCVIIRNSFQSFQIEALLTSIDIPYEKYGGLKFLEKEHVKDALAYLRCITNPKDEIAWFRILKLHEGIGDTFARNISAKCKEKGSAALLDKAYEKRKFYSELILLKEHIENLSELELEEMIRYVIDFYFELNERNIRNMRTDDEDMREEMFIKNKAKKEELRTLISLTEGYTNILEFLDDLTLDNKNNENTDKLVISTIHSAKGLEWDTVFILDCIQEVCPSTTEDMRGTEEDNEELRCFYVAVTRAKNNLYLLVPFIMNKYGQAFQSKLSHYLENVLFYVKV